MALLSLTVLNCVITQAKSTETLKLRYSFNAIIHSEEEVCQSKCLTYNFVIQNSLQQISHNETSSFTCIKKRNPRPFGVASKFACLLIYPHRFRCVYLSIKRCRRTLEQQQFTTTTGKERDFKTNPSSQENIYILYAAVYTQVLTYSLLLGTIHINYRIVLRM